MNSYTPVNPIFDFTTLAELVALEAKEKAEAERREREAEEARRMNALLDAFVL